jgi:hypothetical protein
VTDKCDPVPPSRVFGSTAYGQHVAVPLDSSPGIRPPSRVFHIRRVPRVLVRETTAPLALSSALWVSAADSGRTRLRNPTRPLFGFCVPPESYPVEPSRPLRRSGAIGASRGLCLPSAHSGRKDPLSAGIALPASFRLQGLATLLAVSSPRGLAGPVSSRQRSWDSSLRSFPLPKGGRRVTAAAGPACRQPHAISRRQRLRAGAQNTDFRALTLPGVPGPPTSD